MVQFIQGLIRIFHNSVREQNMYVFLLVYIQKIIIFKNKSLVDVETIT